MKFGKILLLICFALSVLDVFAGPTVITDNRIHDLSITPVLGRGYSIATNTFQSTCLNKVNVTEPSYDFTYLFNSIELEGEGSGELESKIDVRSFSEAFRNELVKRLIPSFRNREPGEETYFNHNIYVEINLNSYYASLDESETKMSSSAAQLLVNNDIPGFFSSCGSYYVRSIGRNAKFVAIFTYKSRERKPDRKFESDLEAEITGFGKEMKNRLAQEVLESAVVAMGGTSALEFRKRAASRKLTINVAAFGLGKNEKATLISYDIDTFKQSIADAFISMQNPKTGKVSSIEVVPWVENTDFQALIKLEEDTEPVAPPAEGEQADAEAAGEKEPRKLLLYEKKNILNLNAEFMAEGERMDRKLLNLYYKAKICRKYIDENWKNSGSLKLEYRNKNVLNNKVGGTYPLTRLDQLLTQAKIDDLLEDEYRFLHGDGGSNKGWSQCLKDIMRQGIFRVSYRDTPSCRTVLANMEDKENQIIENHCMPMLAK